MFHHVNPKNGEKAPLIDSKVYDVIMVRSEEHGDACSSLGLQHRFHLTFLAPPHPTSLDSGQCRAPGLRNCL